MSWAGGVKARMLAYSCLESAAGAQRVAMELELFGYWRPTEVVIADTLARDLLDRVLGTFNERGWGAQV